MLSFASRLLFAVKRRIGPDHEPAVEKLEQQLSAKSILTEK